MGVSVRQWTKVVTMASVRTSVMILYSVIITITCVAGHGYRDNHHGVRRKVIIVKKSRDHGHVYPNRHVYQDRHHGYQAGAVSVLSMITTISLMLLLLTMEHQVMFNHLL